MFILKKLPPRNPRMTTILVEKISTTQDVLKRKLRAIRNTARLPATKAKRKVTTRKEAGFFQVTSKARAAYPNRVKSWIKASRNVASHFPAQKRHAGTPANAIRSRARFSLSSEAIRAVKAAAWRRNMVLMPTVKYSKEERGFRPSRVVISPRMEGVGSGAKKSGSNFLEPASSKLR